MKSQENFKNSLRKFYINFRAFPLQFLRYMFIFYYAMRSQSTVYCIRVVSQARFFKSCWSSDLRLRKCRYTKVQVSKSQNMELGIIWFQKLEFDLFKLTYKKYFLINYVWFTKLLKWLKLDKNSILTYMQHNQINMKNWQLDMTKKCRVAVWLVCQSH